MKWDLKKLEEKLLIGSTLVEGSTLTESEAKTVLSGKTVMGHPISEAQELLNYRAAVIWFTEQMDQSHYLSEDIILGFHRFLFAGTNLKAGVFKSHVNYTYQANGQRHDFLHPSKVKMAILDWLKNYNEKTQLDVKNAALFYCEFEAIHPFEDGNGRIGRVLIAYWLHSRFGYEFSFYLKDKIEHLDAIRAASGGDFLKLQAFFKKRIRK